MCEAAHEGTREGMAEPLLELSKDRCCTTIGGHGRAVVSRLVFQEFQVSLGIRP